MCWRPMFLLTVTLFAAFSASPASAWWHDYRDARHPVFPRRDALPNPRLTPGALNPAVTQANIHETICVRGYTRSIRPPERYTESLKRRQIREYDYPQDMNRLWFFEEDHLISLELGGSPSSPRNLWPEPHRVAGGWGSYAKDRLENKLNHLVCSGRLPLADAQRMIARNWISAYRRYIGPIPDDRKVW
ncbi:hypothetical protein Thpro_022012 [Acidihalobacter prosperus]|uniref:Uncharacterized protein n=2 Tax=Acidihalobacter prosperus TaxID=160660 RepID=A0A1A6C557_9GAMM|nr:hypothetical protein Thpro_022012 [Acidihalobacter prosperus]